MRSQNGGSCGFTSIEHRKRGESSSVVLAKAVGKAGCRKVEVPIRGIRMLELAQDSNQRRVAAFYSPIGRMIMGSEKFWCVPMASTMEAIRRALKLVPLSERIT